MKYFLISDNVDTKTGLRLVGIDGVVVHEKDETEQAIRDAMADPDIGILIITENLRKLCSDTVTDIIQNRHLPLIVEIPDRHGFGRDRNSVSNYIESAIGLKM